MAFLDNSGDILLDAVLTDAGRKRMAEGTFRITKFALADDEIDYSLYDFSDVRGSPYYDLDILSTPILEAFTDNAAGLKSKLVSYGRNDLEYLPIMKLYEKDANFKRNANTKSFLFSVSDETDTKIFNVAGVISKDSTVKGIEIHQGIDNVAMPPTIELEAELRETSFIIEMDNRICQLTSVGRDSDQSPAYIDDDNIASYIVSTDLVNFISTLDNAAGTTTSVTNASSIVGRRNRSKLQFSLKPREELASNDFLMTTLGGEVTGTNIDSSLSTSNFYYIDLNIRVMGAVTGFRIDIPVRFIKLKV